MSLAKTILTAIDAFHDSQILSTLASIKVSMEELTSKQVVSLIPFIFYRRLCGSIRTLGNARQWSLVDVIEHAVVAHPQLEYETLVAILTSGTPEENLAVTGSRQFFDWRAKYALAFDALVAGRDVGTIQSTELLEQMREDTIYEAYLYILTAKQIGYIEDCWKSYGPKNLQEVLPFHKKMICDFVTRGATTQKKGK